MAFDTRLLQVDPAHVRFSARGHDHAFDDPSLEIAEPTSSHIVQAVDLLHREEVVAFPTETVYGLGANAQSSAAVARIYAAKNRPSDNPLILHVASLAFLRKLLGPGQVIPSIYAELIQKFWPGPLTILLPLNRATTGISELCTQSQDTFAVRMPESPIALALLHTAQMALAAPSANASTRPSPTQARHVMHDLHGKIPLILDGGACQVGVESTVVDGLSSPPTILRPGGVSIEQIRATLGWEHVQVYRPNVASSAEVPRTPGMKYRHYSPSAKVVLFETTSTELPSKQLTRDDRILGDNVPADLAIAVISTRTWHDGNDGYSRALSSLKDSLPITRLTLRPLGTKGPEIARGIFAALRELDEAGVHVIFVEGVAESDEGLAIMNRLRKAASLVLD